MKLYALYYYDKPLLSAWLNHYCQFKCITEIIIQNQNWSKPDTMFLLDTVADYIDEFGKKIVVLPSNFIHTEGDKRSQFKAYGQSKIRNRVTQFLQEDTFIASSMDEVIYGRGYRDTEKQLKEFEKLAEKRVEEGQTTVGYLPLLCVWKKEIAPCNGIPIRRFARPNWRHRLFRFALPFQRKRSIIHDTTYQTYQQGKWVDATPPSAAKTKKDIPENGVALDLKLLHYHTLIRVSFESAEFVMPQKKQIKHLRAHPRAYITKLLKLSEVAEFREVAAPKVLAKKQVEPLKRLKLTKGKEYVLQAGANKDPILHIGDTTRYVHLTRETRYCRPKHIDKKTMLLPFRHSDASVDFLFTRQRAGFTIRVTAVDVGSKRKYALYIGSDLIIRKISAEDVGVTITVR